MSSNVPETKQDDVIETSSKHQFDITILGVEKCACCNLPAGYMTDNGLGVVSRHFGKKHLTIFSTDSLVSALRHHAILYGSKERASEVMEYLNIINALIHQKEVRDGEDSSTSQSNSQS
jgi:hypothetical protein